MKQFKTDEEQFRKFIIRAEKLIGNIPDSNDALHIFSLKIATLSTINEYKKELGMLKHPDAVKSTRYVEQEIPFQHEKETI